MIKKLILFAAIFSVAVACAAVKPNRNIIANGTFKTQLRDDAFEAEWLDFPVFWRKGGKEVRFDPTGGPGNTGAVIFSNSTGAEGIDASCRQSELQLIAGETYKISGYVKTIGFKSTHCGIVVHNYGWYKANGIQSFPENTDGWQYIEKMFKLHESDRSYGAAIFAKNYSGEIHFAQIKLEAISDGALAGSSILHALAEYNKIRLVPWEPLLNRILLSDPRMTFHLFGQLERAHTDYDFVSTINNSIIRKSSLAEKQNTVDLSGIAVGDHALDVAIVEHTTGEHVFQMTHAITVVADSEIDVSAHRRLNNLAVEVLAEPLQATAVPQAYEFSTARDGWVFIKAEFLADAPELTIVLDGDDTVITTATDRHEAFRELSRGRHSIVVKDAAQGGRIIVRSISETFNYPTCLNSRVPQNGKYDWDFHTKHVFPAVTTLNGGNIPEEHRPKIRQMGVRWLGSVGTTNPKDVADIVERISTNPGITKPWYDGLTCDEQFFGRTADLAHYIEALRLFDNPEGKLIYSWGTDSLGLPGMHNAFISAALNASQGRGRLLFEAYCHSQPSEEDAVRYLNDRIVGTMKQFNMYYPNASAGFGMILGSFNQIPIISLDVNPEVDYKYYLDLQLNLIANNPVFKDLGTTGYWGSHYADEELYRWSMRLLRHYCVEGNRGMLSEAYGYAYAPGHLKNCDFADGLKHWTATPSDSLRSAAFTGYGKNSQGRWGAPSGTGDSFCVFKRKAGEPGTLTQTAKGLIPGQIYTLQFVTADYKDMMTGTFDPKPLGLDAVLGSGAEVIPEKSYVFVDKRNAGKQKDDGKVRINLHHIRFKATAPSFSVTFTNAKAPIGTEIALNYVMLKPYFTE